MLKTSVDKAGLSLLGSVCLWLWPCSLANIGVLWGAQSLLPQSMPSAVSTQTPGPERSVSCKTRG